MVGFFVGAVLSFHAVAYYPKTKIPAMRGSLFVFRFD